MRINVNTRIYTNINVDPAKRGAYPVDMGRNKKQIGLALDADLLARFDKWLAEQRFPPSRTAVIEDLLKEFLDEQDAKQR